MDFTIAPVSKEDGNAIIDIFNHYVQNSFAAYPEDLVPYPFFSIFLNMAEGYPFLVARDDKGIVLGYALLRAHSPVPVFSRTSEITCFIAAEHTGKGMGKALQESLLAEPAKKESHPSWPASPPSTRPALPFTKNVAFRSVDASRRSVENGARTSMRSGCRR